MSARLTDDLLGLDIRRLKRQARLNAGTNCTISWKGRNYHASIGLEAHANAVTLRYSTNNTPQCYDVAVTTTLCHLGGQRHWWLCPCCNRRCAILYGGAVFVCRKCARLHYPIQHASEFDKAIIRAEAIRYRLGWMPGIAHGEGPKPKGMHWKTYRRYVRLHAQFEQSTISAFTKKFNLTL